MLKQFGHEIWTADGSDVVAMLGFHYPTRMAVIRLSGRGLFIWSPVALTDGLRAAADALGEVRYLVAPNSLHDSFIADWKRAYPAAQVYAAPGLREKRKDIAFDSELGTAPFPDWSDQIEHVLVEGNAITSEVVFFHRESRTVIFTDLIQQFPAKWFSGWRAVMAKWDLMLGAEPSVPQPQCLDDDDRGQSVRHDDRARAATGGDRAGGCGRTARVVISGPQRRKSALF